MRKYRGVECMAKKKKAKTHQNIDGRLLQMNKRFSNLKQKQQQSINDWLYEEYRRIYAKIGMPPDSSYNSNILLAVDSKIEQAGIWLPFDELEKHFISKKNSYKNRYEREIERVLLLLMMLTLPATVRLLLHSPITL